MMADLSGAGKISTYVKDLQRFSVGPLKV